MTSDKKYEIDMLQGSLMKKLVEFSLPLMFSSILQLLFNAADLIVVGRFAGNDSLAAVGATSALISIFINLFIGVSLGTNVFAARYRATGEYDKMSKVIHTSILAAVIFGVVMSIIGRIFALPALTLMETPAGVINKSVTYMKIYFIGTPFFMLYNFGAAVMRAVGDTKRPMLYLVISGIVNAVLNVILVTRFNMDVSGVAIATVFSQMISCVLVIVALKKNPEEYRLYFSKLKIDFKSFKDIIRVGIPCGLQSVVINFSNALLQSSVNSFGENAMAGYTAANNIFGFLYVSINAVTQGCMSFTGQNFGAKKYDRCHKILLNCLILETVVGLSLGSVAFFMGRQILGIYSTSSVVIDYGMQVLLYTTVTYFLCGYMDCIPGSLRGMGYSTVPMILSIIGTVGTRFVWIYGFFPHRHEMTFLFLCYPLSWTVTIIMQAVCYTLIRRKLRKA